MKTADLNSKIAQYLDDLARLTDEARISQAMQAYLETCARFHKYSSNNQMLIWLACPEATQVAGYNDWLKKFHRYVRRGEKGIPILAPCVKKSEGEGDPGYLYFRTVYVFDVSQTEGEPLPPPPDWCSPAKSAELQSRLQAYAQSLGVAVAEQALKGNTQGYSQPGRIVLSPEAGTKTLIHELAHEFLHQRNSNGASRQSMEHEAEAVAYVVARHFGLEGLKSANYLALWDADGKVIRANLERARSCAAEIIAAIETQGSGQVPGGISADTGDQP